MCSVSYQSLNSSSATFVKSIAAIKTPFAITVPSDLSNRRMLRRESSHCTRLGRHPLFGQFAPGVFVLVEIKAHRVQHMRGLGELDIGVFDDLDAIAPGIEKIEEGARNQLPAGRHDPLAHARAVVDDEPEMA